MISWKNPDQDDRDLGMDDYRELGIYAAMQAVASIVPGRQPHGVGYCLGGTLLSVAAAEIVRDGRPGFKTLSFSQRRSISRRQANSHCSPQRARWRFWKM